MKILINSPNVGQPKLVAQGSRELTVAISSLSIGGAERIVLDWATRIYPQWRVHLIVLRNRTKEWSVPSFIRVTRLEDKERMEKLKNIPDISLRRVFQLREIGKEISHSDNPVCVCHLLNKFERDALLEGGAQVVTVLHNAKDGWPEGVECLSGSSQVIAVSEACAHDLRENKWEGPISVIRHIPPKRKIPADAREKFRREWNVPLDATVIGMIGAVKPQKNYLLALKILKEFLRKKDVYLVILGGPINTRHGRSTWESVMAEIKDLNLRSRVAMPGFIPDAAACLPAFDVMLNTSHYEGLSIATLEMLQSGVPVVASKVGGQGEINCDGLKLMDKNASIENWVQALTEKIQSKFEVPSWSDFPSFRLWTLAGIARSVKPSKKVLFVTANLNSGGAQRSLVNLVKSLKGKIPFEVTVAGNTTTPYFHEELKNSGVEVTWAGTFWNAFMYAENIVHKICTEQIGTVCFWNVDARLKLLIVKALGFTKVRFVDVSPGDYIYREMEEVVNFQNLIAFSNEEYFERINSLVLKYHGPAPEKCARKTVVIPNGITQAGKIKSDYAIKDIPRIVVNGRIAETKFILEIIEAMKIVWKKIPKTQLHIFGGAESFHQDYAKKVFAAGQDKRIFFHGVDFEARNQLAEFDAYVVLGLNQGCPNALMEALSVGLPSIGNDDGGTREQLINNQTGLLIKNCDPRELAGALERIIIDRVLAQKIGIAGREHVRKNFSIEKMSDGYRNLFDKLAHENSEWQMFLSKAISYLSVPAEISAFWKRKLKTQEQNQTEAIPA